MKRDNTRIGVLCLILLLFILAFCSVGFASASFDLNKKLNESNAILYETQDELNYIQNKLEITEGELSVSQESLQEEINRIDGLTNELNMLSEELDVANLTITDLKSEEYELAYIGEFAYTYYCDEREPHICGMGIGLTATGNPTEVGWTIAVDPTVIPLGTIVYIEGIGFRIAHDTGGAIEGNHIDILLETHAECFEQTLVNGGVWILVRKNT
jgi:3D (Asp-Asp-Asp) domain-containing protein